MSLETLIHELKRIHDVHPNASVLVTYEEDTPGQFGIVPSYQGTPESVNYDNLSKTAVIEI